MEPTTERLAQALEQAGCPPDMIDNARNGHYDDFKSDLAQPIHQLVADLNVLGQADLATRAINGEFDSTPEESQAWYDAEGRQLLQALAATPSEIELIEITPQN